MKISPASGWAVADDKGTILVATVAPNRVAAMINYLVVVERIMTLNGTSDSTIIALFDQYKSGAQLVEVRILAQGISK